MYIGSYVRIKEETDREKSKLERVLEKETVWQYH